MGKAQVEPSSLPIDPEFLQKRMAIPKKISELSYIDQDSAVKYLRIWGEKRLPVTDLYSLLVDELAAAEVKEAK